ncbi:MAG: hypothetical protein LBQ14_07950 [Treponema sp.]|nr:hypothetical protein [Treponema sp.]
MNITDPVEREKVIGEIRALRNQYAGTEAEYQAPNGKPSLLLEALGEEQGKQAWYAVRTPSFKEWFGDWERAVRIAQLEKSPNLKLDGNAYEGKYDISGTPKENKKSIEAYLKNLKGMRNDHINGPIELGGTGIGKITSWGMNNQTYMKTIAHIPTMLKNAVLISENGPNRANSHYQSFRHLVTGIELDGEPYTVHIVLGENAGIWYYQHILSKIEKGTLIEVIRETNSGLQDSLSDIKDTTLREILQAPNTSKVIDANGEPLAVFRGDKAGLDRFLNKQGIYHAADAEIAKGYSSGGVYKNFLNIKNPLVLNSENRFNKIRDDINDMIYDILEQDWPELENNRRFQDLRKNYLAFRNEEGSTVRDFYNDFLPEVSEETDLEEFKEILLKSLHDTNTFNWRQIDFRDIDILNPYIQTLGYDGIIRPYDSQGQSVGKEYITFSPSQIKSATDNAGIYGRENPSILFQDEAALAAFIRNDPEVVDLAGTFDSWEDFMGYYEVFDEKQPADLRETAAREGFYKTLWEEAKRLGDRETAAETADTGQKTVEDFLDLVNSETGLREIVEGTRGILAEADHFQPESAEEERRYNAELRAVKSAFDHQNWKNARIQLSKDKPISPATARFLRGQVRNNPLPYMQAWAVISGDDSWLPAEQRSRLDSGEDFEAETDTSPEELRRIQQALDYDEVVQKIEDETIQMVDPRLENYEEELKRRQQESREKIDKTKERLSDYAWWIERAEINIHGQERLLAQLKADTTPEGLRAHGRQQRKIKALQNQLLNLRKEYARFFQSVKAADKANFKDFTTLVRMQAKTEQSLEAIRDLRQIRKREIRALTRKPDLNTVHIDEAYLIQWIQSHFDKLYEAIPKFIGKKAKNLQQLFSDFTTQEEYRAELRRKLSPASYRRIEEGVYKDPATREVRPYSELTRAQRHTLYRLLLENEKLFKDVGLDDMEAPKQFSPAESERIRKDLEDRLPPHIIRKLETRVPLDQWQMADVETLAGIMGDIRKEGREHYKARRDAREKVISDYRQQFTEMTGKLLRPQDLARLPGAETEEAEKKRAAPWNLIYGGINARRMIRMMIDGGKDGLGYDVIIGGEDRAFNEQTRHELRRRKVVEERLEAAGIKLKELWSNTFSVDPGEAAKISRSLDEMLFYRRAAPTLNERAYSAVVFGNFTTVNERAALETAYREGRMVDALAIQNKSEKRYKDAMEQLDAFLAKPENAKFRQVETIIGEDYDGNYDRLKEFAAREFNFDMGSEAFYIPLSRLEATGDLMEQETIRDVFSSAGVVQSLAKGFTLSRVDIPPWGQMPVKAGLYKTWDQMVTKQEHLMAYAGYLREMRQIFQGRGSEVLMSNIQRRFTLAGKDYLTHYISELANPNPQRDYTNLDTITRLMRGHYPAAVLAFRLSSIIKQAITSPPPFLQFVSAAQYAGAAARCLSEETRKMIREKSAYMASRVIDPANEFIRQMELSSLMGKSGKVQAALTKAESIGMKGLEWIDSVCVMPGWLAAYDQKRAELNRQEGTDPTTIEAEAVKYADQVVRDTQPSSRQVDLAPIFKHQKNPFMQMFLQFQVPQSVIMQNLFVDAPNNFKQGRAGAALTTFALYGLTAAVVGILEEDEDEEKLNPKYRGIDAAVGYLESIPIAGGYASYTVEHFLRTGKVKLSQFKPFPVLDEAFRAGAAVTQEQWDQAFSRSLRALGYYSGLPVGLWGEIDKAIKDGDWTVLLGWK